jgi:hypothetical protein
VVSALTLGAQVACNEKPAPSSGSAEASGQALEAQAVPSAAASAGAVTERQRDCCMGKNECKGKGGCAVPESHGCKGQNACKGKGGCNMHCPK